MKFKRLCAIMAAAIVLAALPISALALWVKDGAAHVGSRTFQCSDNGELEIRFFDPEGAQLHFYKLAGDYFVDDAEQKDAFLEEGYEDAGAILLVSEVSARITYLSDRFGYIELVDKPAPGFVLNRFIDSSCNCYTEFKLVDGAYHVTPDSVESITAIFEPAATTDLTIILDGKTVESDVPAFLENERTMVPVRFVSEALGAEVAWDAAARTVSVAAADGTLINLRIGCPKMSITKGEDTSVVTMDVPTVIKEGRTFVPVRFVAEALGLTVGWEEATRTVLLTSE